MFPRNDGQLNRCSISHEMCTWVFCCYIIVFWNNVTVSIRCWFFLIITRGPFGLRVLSSHVFVCVCVCLCVNFLLVQTKTHHPFKLGLSHLDQEKNNTLLQVPIVLGLIQPNLTGPISLHFKVFFICITFASLKYLLDVQKQSLLNCSTSHMAPHTY